MERLLVTGVDGPLGSNLALALAEPFEVLGLYDRYVVESSAVRTAACARNDCTRLGELARDWQPAWILDCGPLSAGAWDRPASQERGATEPRVVSHLSQLAKELSARLTVLSSDVVFAGPRMFHEESWTPGSTSTWAGDVLAMESALANTPTLVVRTHAYGWSPVEAHAGFAEWAIDAVISGRDADMDGRRHATPILASDLASYLSRAYELRLEGLHHVAGAERTSPYCFVTQLAAALGLHLSCGPIERPFDTTGTGGAEPPRTETSLSSKRARRALEMTMPMLRDGLSRFADQRHNGWRQRIWSLGPLCKALELAA